MKRMLPIFLVLATPALAGPREDTLAGIERCRALSNDRVFLDCVYGAAQPLRTALGLAPATPGQVGLVPPAPGAAPRPAPMMPAPIPAARAQTAPQPRLPGGQAIGKATRDWLETYSFDRRGLFTILLGNGQMFRQDPSDPARADWRGRASDYRVMLVMENARTGQMSVQGDKPVYRVVKID